MQTPTRYEALVRDVVTAVTDSPAQTDASLRRALVDGKMKDVPETVRQYLQTVRQLAYRVTDRDVEDLRRAGHSEDAIFEMTAAAALGAALERLRAGMSALEETR